MTVLKEQLMQFLCMGEDKRVVIIGVGNPIRKDDAVGLEVIDHLEKKGMENVFLLKAESVPENFIGPIRKFKPTHVLMVDSANLGEKPGEFRIIPTLSIAEDRISTHKPSINLLLTFIRKTMLADVALIGVQPKSVGFGTELSAEVKMAAAKIANIIYRTLLCCNG